MTIILILASLDDSLQKDGFDFLNEQYPSGVWGSGHQDSNGDAHFKAAIIGPQETIQIVNGKMVPSTWQSILL